MKNLIALISILVFTLSSFAQTAKVEGTKEDLKNNLAKNLVVFVMPSEITAEKIDKSAQYYTSYFTVDYNGSSKVAKILLVSEDETNRKVIIRFLLSTGVRIIDFDGAEYTIMEFYSNFLE